jgi:hypothetical protein
MPPLNGLHGGGPAVVPDWTIPMVPEPPSPPFQSPTASLASYFSSDGSLGSHVEQVYTNFMQQATGAPRPGPSPAHWATKIVSNSAITSTKFPRSLREAAACHGEQVPNASQLLLAEKFVPVAKMSFPLEMLEVRFYWRAVDDRARLFFRKNVQGSAGELVELTYCFPLASLKLIRSKASVEMFRYNRRTNELEKYARLNFADHERIVLFYSIFAAMKNQDAAPRPDELREDYFVTDKMEEEVKFSG